MGLFRGVWELSGWREVRSIDVCTKARNSKTGGAAWSGSFVVRESCDEERLWQVSGLVRKQQLGTMMESSRHSRSTKAPASTPCRPTNHTLVGPISRYLVFLAFSLTRRPTLYPNCRYAQAKQPFKTSKLRRGNHRSPKNAERGLEAKLDSPTLGPFDGQIQIYLQ